MSRSLQLGLLTAFLTIAAAVLFYCADGGVRVQAQGERASCCPNGVPLLLLQEEQKMPEVVIMAKDAKLGPVTFPHAKHNGGEYSIVPGQAITCTQCHHTARPAAEIAKNPPLKTAWPADRTTTLTAELFKSDPKAAGVAACRDCHVKEGMKPKLLDAIPQVKHESTTAMITLTNMNTFHRNCTGCHAEARKANAAAKGPIQIQCALCHKKPA